MRLLVPAILSAAFALGVPTRARSLDLPPPYRPRESVSGTIRIWGHGAYDRRRDFIGALVRAWESGFRRFEPRVRFENHLVGTAAAIGSLYTGRGDLALMGREIWPPEIAAFKEVYGYAPTGLDVVTGSLDVRNRDYALVVFVNRENPIKGLTLSQLHAVFGSSMAWAPGRHAPGVSSASPAPGAIGRFISMDCRSRAGLRGFSSSGSSTGMLSGAPACGSSPT